MKMNTIWGYAHEVKLIAEGITWVSTGSHGGYVLSKERLAQMPAQYRACSYTKDNNFEEDCSWCGVVLAWSAYFDPMHVVAAQDTFNRCYNSDRQVARA